MKNLLILVALSLFSLPILAQFTKGGSEKNYERYRMSKDSIVTIEKIPINTVSKTTYTGFWIGLSSPLDDLSKTDPSFSTVYNTGSLFAPYSTGEMGLKSGINLAFNGIAALNSINKNLIRNIDLGLTYSYFFSTVGFDFKQIVSDSNGFYQNFYNTEAKYTPFLIFGIGLGPSITIIPNPTKPSLLIDLYARGNLTFIGGGTFSGRYTYPSGTYYDISTEREELSMIFSQTFGATLRLDKIAFFLEANLGMTNDKMDAQYTRTYLTNNSNVNDYTLPLDVSTQFNLNHLKVGISLPLKTKY